MKPWNEEDHPRDERGRFIDKVNAFLMNYGKAPLLQDGRLNFLQFPYLIENPKREDLTRQEWARWYDRIYEIERGYFVPRRLGRKKLIQLGNKIVVTGGTYVKPKALKIIVLLNEEDADDFIEVMHNG